MASTFKINYPILFFILTLLISGVSLAKKHLTPAQNQDTSTKVYVLSNRQTVIQGNETTTLNKVNSNHQLDFIRASSNSKDSLHITRGDSTDFLSEISSLEGNWLVFVHGDAKTLEQSIIRGIKIKQLYNINVLVFSWPSSDPRLRGARNLKRSQSHVAQSKDHFIQLLKFVDVFKTSNPTIDQDYKISLLFHSLGNLYLEELVNNELHLELSDNLFDNIILNAAAVNQKNHKEWVEQLSIQRRIFINSNKHDFNLKGLRIFSPSGKQLGEKITPTLASNASYIHFDKSVGFRLKTGQTHTYFIGKIPDKSSNIKSYYHSLFHGEEPNLTNENKFSPRKDGMGYEAIFNTTN